MKAVQFQSFGNPDVLEVVDLPIPQPKAGEVLVRVTAAGINFIDIYRRTGLYKTNLPCIAGEEGAGTVEKAGSDSAFSPGTPVAWAQIPGAYAEYALIPEAKLVTVPASLELKQAAAAMLQGMTAQYLSETTFPIKPGDSALVHAGAGGVGLLLIQILKHKGAHVFTTVSSNEKAQLAKEAGADQIIRYTEEDFVATIKEATGGQGIDVVFDSVGLTTYEGSLKVLRPLGMLILFGQSSGKVPGIEPTTLLEKGSLFLTRPSLTHYVLTRDALVQRAQRVFEWLLNDQLHLRIEHVYPLAEAAQAHRDLESRRTTGKLLLLP